MRRSQPDLAATLPGVTEPARDPRTGPVEDNLLDLLAGLAATPGFASERRTDVTTWSSPVEHPLFNGVAGARFPAGEAAARTGEVLGAYLARGRPFLWWTTPSTTSPRLEQVLSYLGMQRADSPGMHLALDGAPAAVRDAAPGVEVRPVPSHERVLDEVLVAAFGMSASLVEPLTRSIGGLDATRLHEVLALVDGVPAGGGSLWVTGRTAGLYNIGTLEAARGRGVGTAVTAALVDRARELGCTEVVLHASASGLGVYRRLGFTAVCTVGQHLWVPPAG
jgi:ribosomal protein S18 acetylase RimI-like enzyme